MGLDRTTLGKLASVGAVAIALCAITGGGLHFLRVVAALHPLPEWLSFRYVGYVVGGAVWTLSCFSLGALVLWPLRARIRWTERLVHTFAAGVVAFGLVVFLIGVCGGFRRYVFWLIPVGCLLGGAYPTWKLLARARRQLAHARRRGVRPDTLLERGASWFGIVALALVVFPSLSIAHLGFDSAWYHVPIAEHYVAARGIRPFAEGWYLGAYPHLASLLYTWAVLCPLGTAVDRTMLAGTIEAFALFVTLASIPVLVRALVARAPRHSWAAMFLFPMIFIADLEIAADHVAALFAVPIALAWLRFLPTFDARRGVLLAIGVSGAALTKYSAFPMLMFPGLGVFVVFVWRTIGHLRARTPGIRQDLVAVCICGGGVVLLTASHWAKNALFYGDPFYPLLHRVLKPHPFSAEVAAVTDFYLHDLSTFHPPRTWAGSKEALASLFDWSFRVFDFWSMHRDWPLSGSLFTLGSVAVIALRPGRRVLLVVAATYVTLFFWYTQSHVDRYLQAPLPMMAAATAALGVVLWRRGVVLRIAVCAAVSLQVLWGLSVLGLPGYQRKTGAALHLADRAYMRELSELNGSLGSWMEIGKTLPRRSKALVHDTWAHTGLERASVSDIPGVQGGIHYGTLAGPADVHALLRGLRVTHLVSGGPLSGDDSIAGDLRYWEFERWYTDTVANVEGRRVAALQATPPPARTTPDDVLVIACSAESGYATGVYAIGQLDQSRLGGRLHGTVPKPRPADDVAALATRVRFAAVDAACPASDSTAIGTSMSHLVRSGHFTLYARR